MIPSAIIDRISLCSSLFQNMLQCVFAVFTMLCSILQLFRVFCRSRHYSTMLSCILQYPSILQYGVCHGTLLCRNSQYPAIFCSTLQCCNACVQFSAAICPTTVAPCWLLDCSDQLGNSSRPASCAAALACRALHLSPSCENQFRLCNIWSWASFAPTLTRAHTHTHTHTRARALPLDDYMCCTRKHILAGPSF